MIRDIPIQKGRKQREKGATSSKQFQNPAGKYYISRPEYIHLWFLLCPLGSRPPSWITLPLFMKGSMSAAKQFYLPASCLQNYEKFKNLLSPFMLSSQFQMQCSS